MDAVLMDALPEKELVHQARLGQSGALEELVRRFYPDLHGYLSRLLGPHEAEDALQDVFIKMAQGLHHYHDEDRLGAWLTTIAVNHARDLLRRRAGRRSGPLPEPVCEPMLVANEDQGRLTDAIRRLPDQFAEPLLLIYQQELTQAQVADILGISVAAVKMRIYRAIRQLRALLKEGPP
jgi:RNA polymerase sigma-70 factor (ECF subfamily)